MSGFMHGYHVFGLNVHSELLCPELSPASFAASDVEVRFEAVPRMLDKAIFSRPTVDVGDSCVLLRVPEVGRFLVEKGRSIHIQPDAGVDQKSLRLYLLGSCLGAILHQRGITPLHGCALSYGGGAIVICGRSGAGKSTVAAALASRGYAVLTDDVSVLAVQDQQLMLAPGYPQLKLWLNAMEYFRLSCRDHERVRPDMAKHAVPTTSNFESALKPVRTLLWLNKQAVPAPHLQALTGNARFHAIRKNIYRKKYNALARRQRYFSQCQQFSSRLDVFKLARPEVGNSIEAVADLVEARFLRPNLQQ